MLEEEIGLELRFSLFYRACISKALYRCGYSVVVVVIHKNVRFFVFKDIGLKLVTLMYYDFLINIVTNNFQKY